VYRAVAATQPAVYIIVDIEVFGPFAEAKKFQLSNLYCYGFSGFSR
jgi:hypothetical protein